ncbi:IS1595 family transposase [Candidatus Daviesbacteria bacterium]|nr:IS1595 family transposase [Candidatus Daviesbacteria bacterium]
MEEGFSLGVFLKKFGTPEKCLDTILNLRFPKGVYCDKCTAISKFYKVEGRPLYACSCGFQISPLAGTILEKTTTPLQYWFYAIFIMSTTRSGVSAKQLQRMLEVTYKTAWRMFKQIRMLMAESGGGMLDGIVEVDETFVGGKGKNRAFCQVSNSLDSYSHFP